MSHKPDCALYDGHACNCRPRVVARCEKCGREFLTMPKDGRDPFDPRSGYSGNPLKPRLAEYEICGGAVVPVVR